MRWFYITKCILLYSMWVIGAFFVCISSRSTRTRVSPQSFTVDATKEDRKKGNVSYIILDHRHKVYDIVNTFVIITKPD